MSIRSRSRHCRRPAPQQPLCSAYGIFPLALPQLVSYTLYRWEVNIRAAAIIGVVGAGGVGRDIYVAISLFHYQQLLTLLLMTLIIVTLVDYLSAWVRALQRV